MIEMLKDISDYIFNHKEYKTLGQAGERHLYRALIDLGVKKNQIFRNVYIRHPNSKLTEIDVAVVSRKGVLVFERKAYNGHVYGDGNKDKWIQCIGKQKNYFLSPVLQNEYHVRAMRHFLKESGVDAPVIPFIVMSRDAKWTLKNIKPEWNIIEHNGDFAKVYSRIADFPEMIRHYKKICALMRDSERPPENVREEHLQSLGSKRD